MADFNMKTHDLLPVLQVICQDSAGAAIDLTTATGVVFNMKNSQTNALKINRAAATFVDRPNGIVQYAWQGTDSDTAGDFQGEFEVDFPGVKPETFPNTGNISITFFTDIA